MRTFPIPAVVDDGPPAYIHRRAGECALTDISDVVATVVEALLGLNLLASNGMPCFVFGHELGALIAFEICRNVQAKFPVKALFVSGMTCPQVGSPSPVRSFRSLSWRGII